MRDFQVGMAKADITPELGCLLYGYPSIRHSAKVLDRLSVGVVCIKQDEKELMIISSEVCGITPQLNDRIRECIEEETGVKKENILYAAIHTHSGPVTRTSKGWGVADEDYLDRVLTPGSIRAAKEAISKLQPAVMGIGTAESYAGVNRREMNTEGKIILGQNPEGPYDPTLTVINFRSLSGENIGSITHLALHPTSAGGNFSITRDWPGVMVDRIEEITGADCIYINGAEGDVGPRLKNGTTIGGTTLGDDDCVQEIGQIAAADAEKAFANIGEYEVPEVKMLNGRIFLPYAPVPSQEEVDQMIEAMGDPEKLIDCDITKHAKLLRIRSMYENKQSFPEGIELNQTVASLGELALVPAPFEVFCEIALAIRERSPYQKTLLLGLTGGSNGYMPTQKQLPFGGYEINSFRAAGLLNLEDCTDRYMIEGNVELLEKMYRL